MNTREITKKKEYNKFLKEKEYSQFSQAWEWGDFVRSEGRKVVRLAFFEEDKMFFAISLYKNHLPFGFCYYHAPRIDIKKLSNKQQTFVFKEIEKLLKKEKTVFLRIEPLSKINNTEFPLKKTIDVQPKKTLVLDLMQSEDELQKEMHQKTRYNIRLAKRKEVTIRTAESGDKDFEKFWNIMQETCGRDGFRLHQKKHYKKMLTISSDEFKIRLILAEYKGEVISSNIIASFGNMTTYVHGASSNKHRNLMSPYLLQWQAIKEAKETGHKYYDFFGIDEEKWPGVTRFKKGFGGKEIIFPGTFDLIFCKGHYMLYELLRKIRRMF